MARNQVKKICDIATNFIVIASAIHSIESHVIGFKSCVGPSMLPTIKGSGEYIFIDRISYIKSKYIEHKDYTRGDVVVVVCPYDASKSICKRVTAIEGDRIVNNKNPLHPMEVIIPKGHVWLVGDNPNASHDSRMYGPVPIGLLKGKVIWKLMGGGGSLVLQNEPNNDNNPEPH